MKLTMVPHLYLHGGAPSLNTEPIAYRVTHTPKGRELLILLHGQEWKVTDLGRAVSGWENRRFKTAGEALLALETDLQG